MRARSTSGMGGVYEMEAYLKREQSLARPRPVPLPPGEGTAIAMRMSSMTGRPAFQTLASICAKVLGSARGPRARVGGAPTADRKQRTQQSANDDSSQHDRRVTSQRAAPKSRLAACAPPNRDNSPGHVIRSRPTPPPETKPATSGLGGTNPECPLGDGTEKQPLMSASISPPLDDRRSFRPFEPREPNALQGGQ